MSETKIGFTSLPYEIYHAIFLEASRKAGSRARCRQLAGLCLLARPSYPAACDLLYTSPSIPKRCIWLLARTLRHKPTLAAAVTSLHAYGVDSLAILDLIVLCPRLIQLEVDVVIDQGAETNWSLLFDCVGKQKVERMRWHAKRPSWQNHQEGTSTTRGLVGLLGGVRELDVQHTSFLMTEVLGSPTNLSPSASRLSALSLTMSELPPTFFRRLQPLFSNLETLSMMEVTGVIKEDLSYGLSYLALSLHHLTLVNCTASSTFGAPNPIMNLFSNSNTLLFSFASLESFTADSYICSNTFIRKLPPSLSRLTLHGYYYSQWMTPEWMTRELEWLKTCESARLTELNVVIRDTTDSLRWARPSASRWWAEALFRGSIQFPVTLNIISDQQIL